MVFTSKYGALSAMKVCFWDIKIVSMDQENRVSCRFSQKNLGLKQLKQRGIEPKSMRVDSMN